MNCCKIQLVLEKNQPEILFNNLKLKKNNDLENLEK